MISIFKIIVNNFGINDFLSNIIAFGIAVIMMRKNTKEVLVSLMLIPMPFALATQYLNLHLGLSLAKDLIMGCFLGIGMIIGVAMTSRPVIVPKGR